MNKNYFKAFTLSEVLITLGIIGLIAAMTLPVLMQKLDEQQNISMLKRFYAEFYNATNLIISEYGKPKHWSLIDNDIESSERVLVLYSEQFKIIKICQAGEEGCFHFPVHKYDGTIRISQEDYNTWALQSFVLSNGVTVFFDVNNDNFSVFFDVNGYKKPNKLGVDVFAWAVNGEGHIVRYTDPSLSSGNDEPEYNYAFEIMENGWVKNY